MANSTHKTHLIDIDRLPPSRLEKKSPFDLTKTVRSTDEVIQFLSGAYENQRARQVGEWERVQTIVGGKQLA